MAIFIALIIVMIWASMLASIYAIINPFTQQLGSIQRYNIAYYGAVSSVERAELVLRWHKAWFEWSWWFIYKNTFWNPSDYQNNIIKKQYYWQLALTWLWNGIFWKITSMINWNVIPETWHGDLDSDISSWENYNKLTFEKSLQFAFYKDTSTQSGYYTWVTDANISNIPLSSNLKVSIRVPLKLICAYKNITNCSRNSVSNPLLNNDNNDLDGDGINDDIVVNRSLFGYTWDQQFTIFPSINISWDNTTPADNDTIIRESSVNYYLTDNNNIVFDTSTKDTNPNVVRNGNVDKFNVSPDWVITTWFNNILNNLNTPNPISKMNLKLSLVNYLKFDASDVYPYLEVKVDAWTSIPWKNFNILWEWRAWEYDVKIMIKKPIFDSSAASDFTVLF